VLITNCIDDSVRNRVFLSFIQFLVCSNMHTCTHVEALLPFVVFVHNIYSSHEFDIKIMLIYYYDVNFSLYCVVRSIRTLQEKVCKEFSKLFQRTSVSNRTIRYINSLLNSTSGYRIQL